MGVMGTYMLDHPGLNMEFLAFLSSLLFSLLSSVSR
jgi:hypothetical protein